MAAEDDSAWREIAERLLAQDEAIELKHAFSSPGLRWEGRIFAMHVRGELVVKLPEGRCAELGSDGAAHPFRTGGRELREWVVVGVDRAFEWDALADEALEYAKALSGEDERRLGDETAQGEAPPAVVAGPCRGLDDRRGDQDRGGLRRRRGRRAVDPHCRDVDHRCVRAVAHVDTGARCPTRCARRAPGGSGRPAGRRRRTPPTTAEAL